MAGKQAAMGRQRRVGRDMQVTRRVQRAVVRHAGRKNARRIDTAAVQREVSRRQCVPVVLHGRAVERDGARRKRTGLAERGTAGQRCRLRRNVACRLQIAIGVQGQIRGRQLAALMDGTRRGPVQSCRRHHRAAQDEIALTSLQMHIALLRAQRARAGDVGTLHVEGRRGDELAGVADVTRHVHDHVSPTGEFCRRTLREAIPSQRDGMARVDRSGVIQGACHDADRARHPWKWPPCSPCCPP